MTFNREARERFVDFAASAGARWTGNFRDFNAAIIRMGTLAREAASRSTLSKRKSRGCTARGAAEGEGVESLVARLLGPERADELDRFDRVQLEDVLRVRACQTLSEAGRLLFSVSRDAKRSSNDADRLPPISRAGSAWGNGWCAR